MKKIDLLVLIIMMLLVSVKLGELTEDVNQLKKDAITKHDNTNKPPHFQRVGGNDTNGNKQEIQSK